MVGEQKFASKLTSDVMKYSVPRQLDFYMLKNEGELIPHRTYKKQLK